MQNQQNRNQMTQEAMSAAIGQIAQMYQGQKQKKDTLKGMDTTVMAMSDAGAVTPDFRDKYLAADEEVRPYLFQAIASPMFQAYTAGQSAAAQAQAWDKYKKNWGAGAGGTPQPFVY